MTADAPLVAAWAATLYYMEQALIANQRWAWLGAGLAFGLGILSKYTLALLGLAALVFLITSIPSLAAGCAIHIHISRYCLRSCCSHQ